VLQRKRHSSSELIQPQKSRIRSNINGHPAQVPIQR
jgi:hypothetical protein